MSNVEALILLYDDAIEVLLSLKPDKFPDLTDCVIIEFNLEAGASKPDFTKSIWESGLIIEDIALPPSMIRAVEIKRWDVW